MQPFYILPKINNQGFAQQFQLPKVPWFIWIYRDNEGNVTAIEHIDNFGREFPDRSKDFLDDQKEQKKE